MTINVHFIQVILISFTYLKKFFISLKFSTGLPNFKINNNLHIKKWIDPQEDHGKCLHQILQKSQVIA